MEEPEAPPIRHKPLYRKDLHLSSALLGGEVDYILHNYLAGKRDKLWEDHQLVLRSLQDLDVASYRDFIRNVWGMTKKTMTQLKYKKDYICHLRISLMALNAGLSNWMQKSCIDLKAGTACPTVGEDLINYCCTTDLLNWFEMVVSNKNEIERVAASEIKEDKMTLNGVDLQLIGDIVILKDKTTVTPAPYITALAIAGMTNSRFTTLLYARVADYWKKYPSISLYQKCSEFFEAADYDLSTLGEDLYGVMKCLPSMAIGAVLKHTEMKLESHFLETVTEDLPASRLRNIFCSPVLSLEEAHVRLELSGLWKTMGHPFIQIESSILELRAKGTSPAVPTAREGGEDLANFFKKYWCHSYFKKHHRWPPLTGEQSLPLHIREAYKKGTWEEPSVGAWSHNHWKDVSFLPHMDFDYSIDTSELLSDKAMIHSRSQWGYTYNPAAHKVLYGRPIKRPPKKNQRVILEYLERPEVSLKEVIQRIETGDIPKEWFAMVGVFKECELKRDKGRLFGKLTFEARLYQTATEHNIAEKIFPYIKGQSMTMSEEELKRTILRMSSSLKAYIEHDIIFISVDLSQWCTTWRHESAGPLLRVLDSIFGLNSVYNLTHLFSQISGVLVQDKFWPPPQDESGEPTESMTYISGFLAWLEGLRQKGWTLATLMVIEKTAIEYGTQATLLGQGDNQVICLRHPSTKQLKNLGLSVQGWAEGFLELLEKNMAFIGLVLKPKESWISTSLFEYSREYHIGGCPVSRGLKLASKLLSAPNSQVPTFNTTISSLYASSAGLAGADQTPLMAYYLATFLAQLHLMSRLSGPTRSDERFMTVLLSIGRTVGGLPITPFSGFCYRGVLDSLTVNLSILRTLELTGFSTEVGRVVDLFTLSHRRDPLLLVQDPEALPLATPAQPENYLRNVLSDRLTTFVKNKQLLPLFTEQAKASERQLACDLLNVQPCHPRLANLLYSLSNAGLRQRLLGQFSNTTSLQSVLLREQPGGPRYLQDHLAVMDRAIFSFIEQKRKGPGHGCLHQQCGLLPDDPWCSAEAARRLRARHWFEYNPVGITMAAPQEQFIMAPYATLPFEALPNTILARVENLYPNAYLYRGNFRPYFGSKTSEKVKKGALQIVDSEKQITALRKVLTLKPWLGAASDKNFEDLLNTLVQEKTTISLAQLEILKDTRISGKVDHRVCNPTSARGSMANTLLGFSSHVFLTTDTATNQVRGGQDWSICYQTVFVSAISRLELLHRYGLDVEGNWGLWTQCGQCTIPVEDYSFRLPSPPLYQGMELHKKITEISVVLPSTLPAGDLAGREGLQVHYGRKLAFHFFHCLSPSTGGGGYTQAAPEPDLNITELNRIDLCTTLKHTRLYLEALRPGLLEDLQAFALLSHHAGALSMDNLLHSLMVAGKLQDVYLLSDHKLTLGSISDDFKRQEGRQALIMALLKAKEHSDTSFYRDHNRATPYDSAQTLIKISMLVAQETRNHPASQILSDLLLFAQNNRADPSSILGLIPYSVRPEIVADEAVCCQTIRREAPALPTIHLSLPCSPPLLSAPSGKQLVCKQTRPCIPHLHAACIHGPCVVTTELFWTVQDCSRISEIANELPIHLLDDEEGSLTVAAWHLWRKTCHVQVAQPPSSASRLEFLINTGPEAFLGDPCSLDYSRDLWISSLLAGPRLEPAEPIFLITAEEGWQAVFCCLPLGSVALVRCTRTELLSMDGAVFLETVPCAISPASSTWIFLLRSKDRSTITVPSFSHAWNGVRRDFSTVMRECYDLWQRHNRHCNCMNLLRGLEASLGLDLSSRPLLVTSISRGIRQLELALSELPHERTRNRAGDPNYWMDPATRRTTARGLLKRWCLLRLFYLLARGEMPADWRESYSFSCHCHLEHGRLRLCWLSCEGESVLYRTNESSASLLKSFARVVYPLLPLFTHL
ncbi:RNA-dependent RNA polymerase [Sierra Nevada virus]|uniref:RNA-directed RNA polymerase n=1 Tax=Sierra Nevada virus TaxID=1424280 RepID=A0A067YEZ6_9MONO|nr:RNA-dependent RNA polymerase [Sierra Nevada virus]AHA90827.1 RNA-dependent RNA polymerase [Sierra Nevada virus]